MPAPLVNRIETIQSQLQTLQKRDVEDSTRRTRFLQRQIEEPTLRPNPIETYTEERSEPPPTDFTQALGLLEGLRIQIRQNPISSLAEVTATFDNTPGARQILAQGVNPEDAIQPR